MKKFLATMILAMALVCAFVGCASSGGGDVDQECLEKIAGDYSVVEQDNGNDADYVGGWWALSIGEFDEGVPYLTIYDTVGNPGVEGPILSLDDHQIKVDCTEIQDELPSAHWALDGDTLVVNYEATDKGIELTNNDFPILFVKADESESAE